jgi:hypothetical protein
MNKLSPKANTEMKKISKGTAEEKVFLSYPKLFPFIIK